ncbi:MAG TPA: hypothetical protein VHH34_16100, partial [Pseudonocardiaceae bacterium]|nr:hypothetical protein [Pseudonocardiaceae bacterium]
PSVERYLHLAKLSDADADWWEELVEHSTTRAQWRAALAAREHTLCTARHWRHLAALLPEPVAQPTGTEA